MLRTLAVLLLLAQAGASRSLPAVDVKLADIQAAVKQEIAGKTTDIQIRTVDAGGPHVGIAVVQCGVLGEKCFKLTWRNETAVGEIM